MRHLTSWLHPGSDYGSYKGISQGALHFKRDTFVRLGEIRHLYLEYALIRDDRLKRNIFSQARFYLDAESDEVDTVFENEGINEMTVNRGLRKVYGKQGKGVKFRVRDLGSALSYRVAVENVVLMSSVYSGFNQMMRARDVETGLRLRFSPNRLITHEEDGTFGDLSALYDSFVHYFSALGR